MVKLEELFEAYFDCRSNKRNTSNALAFEIDYESNLIELQNDLNNKTYKIGKSIAFIVNKPVKREIFAADFRDRVVHHFLINKLNPLFEKEFVRNSYSCRIGKGTHHGIHKVDGFIRKCSKNYTKDCYILKLDIRGFFMHIDKMVLVDKLTKFMNEKYLKDDKEFVLELFKQIIFNKPTENCIIKSKPNEWDDLPKDKSLFFSKANSGLPIGNLTSQIIANFYLNCFDHFVKYDLKIKYYGRYVDDFIIIHEDKKYLKSLINILTTYLQKELGLVLHPKKIYLQHYSKGVKFLGSVIKPNRIYIANRTKGNFYNAIQKQNSVANDHKPNKSEILNFLCSMNSYLGIMKHYKTHKLKKNLILKYLSQQWLRHVHLSYDTYKFIKNKIKKSK